jgi:demethylmenaquinone methyltransferase/2-methoxy-6-polyprenyl-1,4-benzoquinol methylase
MSFRSRFDCLWCGRPWATRGPDDIEGFARLCPDCIGRAGDNGFLRFRLRAALDERARASNPAPVSPAPSPASPVAGPGLAAASDDLSAEMVAYYEARAGEYDDWYLRRGRYERGPVHDQAWNAELDQATRWLDGLPLSGEIVEPAAGTGWWSPLLASKGELSIHDAAEGPLDRARDRLLAHGLRAHIHVRDAWSEPDRQVDALFLGFWLSHLTRERLGPFLSLARRWLKPGGLLAFIDSRPDPYSGAVDQPPTTEVEAAAGIVRRRVADGREFRIVKVIHEPGDLATALAAAGFTAVEIGTTARFFVLGRASA